MHHDQLIRRAIEEHFRNDVDMAHSERERLEAADRELRARAATLVDAVFDRFSDNSCTNTIAPGLVRRFDNEEFIDGAWSGEWTVRNGPPDGYCDTKIIRRWVKLEAPTEGLARLAPHGRYFMTRLMIGTHDMQIHRGSGREDTIRAIGLEALTTLFTLPTKHVETYDDEDCEDDDDGDNYCNFPVYHEQLDCRFAPNEYDPPVFDDIAEIRRNGFTGKIKVCDYPSPHECIAAAHSALDALDDVLF